MEKKETNTLSIFQRPVWVSLFALTAAISWGWAYPLIKMGMEEYQITADMTGSKMLFAGIRFFISEEWKFQIPDEYKCLVPSPLCTPQHHPSLCLLLFRTLA